LALKATPADSLQKANQLYANNEFHTAAEIYENILDAGYESAALYYNLGNSYYKSAEYTRAILNYERALLLAPNDEDIKFNLKLAKQFVVDNIDPIPTPFFVKWFWNISNLQTADNWALISLISFIVVLLFALIYLFARTIGLKKTGFILAISFFLFSGFAFILAQKQYSKITNRNQAVIFAPTVTVKASPDASGTDLFVIHEGLKVEILQKINQWIEIRLEDGNTGWVVEEVLEPI
jgi:tetratricopeptide (TPR) repeat protein